MYVPRRFIGRTRTATCTFDPPACAMAGSYAWELRHTHSLPSAHWTRLSPATSDSCTVLVLQPHATGTVIRGSGCSTRAHLQWWVRPQQHCVPADGPVRRRGGALAQQQPCHTRASASGAELAVSQLPGQRQPSKASAVPLPQLSPSEDSSADQRGCAAAACGCGARQHSPRGRWCYQPVLNRWQCPCEGSLEERERVPVWVVGLESWQQCLVCQPLLQQRCSRASPLAVATGASRLSH